MKLPDSVIPSEELDLFLNDKTGPANYVNDLTELAIPFGAIATDLVSGERVVLQKDVSLGMAMRASMSLPGVFAPQHRFLDRRCRLESQGSRHPAG